MADAMTIALLGQPNSGKSTFYNALTGAHQHVGNWPGKTVERSVGRFQQGSRRYTVVDLPGTYSLAANSDEEIITRDYIAGGQADLVCLLADASQLERSLFMLADYAGIQVPSVLLLNMMDVAQAQGKQIDTEAIQQKLGIPVLPFMASDKKQYGGFYHILEQQNTSGRTLSDQTLADHYASEFGEAYHTVTDLLPENGIGVYGRSWLFAKLVERDPAANTLVKNTVSAEAYAKIHTALDGIENGSSRTGNCKFAWIDDLLANAVQGAPQASSRSKFDRIATSRRWGKPLAVIIILATLMASILVGLPVMAIGSSLPAVTGPMEQALLHAGAHPLIVSLLFDGVWTAFSFTLMMCGYVFGATLVFGLLEEIGYMARISYVFDGTMRRLGLHGKAVMPFLVSFGCNIAGASSSRVLDSWSQRMAAIAMSWVVPCGSTWAVVGLVGSVFFGPGVVLIIVALFAVSVLHLWLTSKVFGNRLLTDADRTGLIMELPPYHKPRWGSLILAALRKMWSAFKRAISIITIFAVVLTLLSWSPSGALSGSVIGRMGSVIEPVTLFFGLRWQTFIAWIGSMMGKEGSLGVLAATFHNTSVAHSVAKMSVETADTASISTALAASLSKPEALAFLFAFYFNMPCVMSLSASMHETHSRKWPLLVAGYYILVSLLLACIVYHLALLVF